MEREKLSSRLGFILLSAGCAIGIGNVWRFPYITGQNGGGIFVLIYLFFLIVMGLPILTMEFAVGRASRQSAMGACATLSQSKLKWRSNRVTYFLEDFILEDGKVGYGGAYLAGKGVVGYAVFVQIPGNLIEVAADPAVLGCQLPDSGKQLVIDRRHMDNRAYGRPPYRLPEKFGLADTIGRKPRCEVGILIFGQPGFHNAAAVGRVVFLSHGVTSFLARKGA